MKNFYADDPYFKEDRKHEFDILWVTELSMYPPLDTMPPSLREKLKGFACQMYFRGGQETQLLIERRYPDWNKDKDDL